MNCPVCNRNLAPTLSICPSCGAMMNDSVREELKDRISTAPKLVVNPNAPAVAKPVLSVANVKAELPVETLPKPQPLLKQTVAAAASAPAVKSHTSEITAKPTSPTLVEFQNKNATVPEWRLQLQNAVRKRVETVPSAPVEMTAMVGRVQLRTSGANALKAEIVEEAAPVAVAGGNAKLANALKRIEESRKRFLADEPKEESVPKPPPAGAAKSYPFYIATKNAEILPKPAEIKAESKPAAPAVLPPKLEDLPVIEKKPFDTNKLKAL